MQPLIETKLALVGQQSNCWHVRIATEINPVEDLFRPQFWANCGRKLSNGDLIRVEAIDGSYDFQLKVMAKTVSGKPAIRVAFHPNLPDYVIAAASLATEMIPTTINGRAVPRVDFAAADGWRVIGLDGNVASRLHESEAAANIAMISYLDVYGFKTVADRPPVDGRTGEAQKPRHVTEGPPLPAPDLNISFQRRKEAEAKAKKADRRQADIEAMKSSRQATHETAKAEETA